jgi:hypothetical protein
MVIRGFDFMPIKSSGHYSVAFRTGGHSPCQATLCNNTETPSLQAPLHFFSPPENKNWPVAHLIGATTIHHSYLLFFTARLSI